MNLALVIDHFHPTKGGAEKSLERILVALRARGHALQLCVISAGPHSIPDLEVHRVSVPPAPRGFRDWLFSRSAARLLQRRSPDLILGVRHLSHADVILARGGFYAQTLEANRRVTPGWWKAAAFALSPKHRFLLQMERTLFSQRPGEKSPLVIAPSNLVRRYGQMHYELPSERMPVVHTGADLHRFRPATPAEREALRRKYRAADRVVALFAAHNFRLKGLHCLLNAWKALPQDRFKLLVAGRGSWRSEWTAPNVEFLGAQSDLVELCQAADFLVHPTFYDPFSRVAIEAMACGLPVITTRFNGASEIIRDGSDGFVIDDPRQSEALADRMARFQTPGLRATFAAAARQKAESHPEEKFLSETVSWIEQEAASHGRRSMPCNPPSLEPR